MSTKCASNPYPLFFPVASVCKGRAGEGAGGGISSSRIENTCMAGLMSSHHACRQVDDMRRVVLLEAREGGSLVPQVGVLATQENECGAPRHLWLVVHHPFDPLANQAASPRHDNSRHGELTLELGLA